MASFKIPVNVLGNHSVDGEVGRQVPRAVHIFPRFANQSFIDRLRARYDPLHQVIEPHITLVFPFESDISAIDLESHVRQRLSGVKPFRLLLRGVTGSAGGYLYLNVKRGNDEIVALHDTLYTGPLQHFLNRGSTYVPHMTVGRIDDLSDFEEAVQETQDLRDAFETVVAAISIESIMEGGVSRIEAVVEL